MPSEEKMRECYEYAEHLLSITKKYKDLIRDKRDFQEVLQEAMMSFAKADDSRGVDKPEHYIAVTIYNILKGRIGEKKKAEGMVVPLPEEGPFEEGERRGEDEVRNLIFGFLKEDTLTLEQKIVLKDCLERLSRDESALWYDFFVLNYTAPELTPTYNMKPEKIGFEARKVYSKVVDCVNGE